MKIRKFILRDEADTQFDDLITKEQYDNEKIILSSEDYDGTEFEAYLK